MRRKRLYIIFFALLQLVVFITPMVIKLVHHHEAEQVLLLHNTQNTLVKGIDNCPICHFEFVNIISNDSEKPHCDSQNIVILLNSGQTSQFLNTPHRYFSNRAPPLAVA